MNPMEWIDARCGAPRTLKTNGDRIRGMSDEDLAGFLVKPGIPDFCAELADCYEAIDSDIDIPEWRCVECTLRWLRSTGEEDEGCK